MDNVVRCYRGIDPDDGIDSLFAVKNGCVAPNVYEGPDDNWCDPEKFGEFGDWVNGDGEQYASVLAALDQFELLWEKQE